MSELRDGSSRYRSVYVAETGGRTVLTTGKAPLRGGSKLPDRDGVHLDTTNGRVPTIFAHARLSPTHVLVGEFDVRYLTSLLRHAEGRVHLIDANLRTVLATEGFLAFQKLSTDLHRAAGDGLKGSPGAGVATVHGVPTLVAAAPVTVTQTTAELSWVLVAERPVSDFKLPVNDVRRGAWMVGFAGICVALVLLGWLYFLVVQPLRALAKAADRLADGDVDTVIPPARQDEVGAIAVCLDICRQAKAHGADRLAGAIRLRGGGSGQTVVLPRIPAQRKRDRARIRPGTTRRRP